MNLSFWSLSPVLETIQWLEQITVDISYSPCMHTERNQSPTRWTKDRFHECNDGFFCVLIFTVTSTLKRGRKSNISLVKNHVPILQGSRLQDNLVWLKFQIMIGHSGLERLTPNSSCRWNVDFEEVLRLKSLILIHPSSCPKGMCCTSQGCQVLLQQRSRWPCKVKLHDFPWNEKLPSARIRRIRWCRQTQRPSVLSTCAIISRSLPETADLFITPRVIF